MSQNPQRRVGSFPGEHLFACDRCGFITNSPDKMKEWTGLVVCKWCYEERHPLTIPFRMPLERPTVPNMRPIIYEDANLCTVQGSSGVVGLAVVGCAVIGKVNPFFS